MSSSSMLTARRCVPLNREPGVEPAVRRRIEDALVRIETERGVRVLLAVESGSRAWGFPSADSDYDVRFIYVAALSDYLSIAARHDVIEQPIADSLDVTGWDLRKALQLAIRSNAVLLEWLSSPLRYREELSLTGPLREIVGAAAHLPAVQYHYDRITRRVLSEIFDAEAPRLKSYFYALRPALALRWLRRHRAPPPMDLSSLMAGVDVPEQVGRAVGELLARKADAREGDTTARVPILDAYLHDTISREVLRPVEKPDISTAAERAQRFFASVLLPPDRL